MRKLLLMVACVALLPASSGAAPGHVTKEAHYGCTNWNEYEGLVIMAAGGQTQAFQDELTRAALADECTTFHAGEEVVVIETRTGKPDPLFGGKRVTLSKISFKGRGSRGWWTSPGMIR
jgi:hypothetical protein